MSIHGRRHFDIRSVRHILRSGHTQHADVRERLQAHGETEGRVMQGLFEKLKLVIRTITDFPVIYENIYFIIIFCFYYYCYFY